VLDANPDTNNTPLAVIAAPDAVVVAAPLLIAGKPVWLETVTGGGRGSTGWTAPEKPLKQTLDELLLKSQQSISMAEAIWNFSNRRRMAAAR
jgi:hypothetical protein